MTERLPGTYSKVKLVEINIWFHDSKRLNEKPKANTLEGVWGNLFLISPKSTQHKKVFVKLVNENLSGVARQLLSATVTGTALFAAVVNGGNHSRRVPRVATQSQ
jgi:hypothetical protein